MDAIPIWVLFVISVIFVVVAIEVGYRLGQSAHRRTEEEME